MSDNASSNYLMTRELQSTLEASRIESSALRNHIPWMAHVIQLALCAFMCSLVVKAGTRSWDAHECNTQFGQNESMDIGKSQRLRREGTTGINEVSAMKPGLSKIIEKVHISRYFECSETDLHIEENGCCIDYTDTWSSKRVHWLSRRQSPYRGTSDYGCHDPLELDGGVGWARLLITWLHTRVAWKAQITAITGHSSQPKMNAPLWSMSWKCWGNSDIEPCCCRRCIQSHCIELSQCTEICSITWMVWCELWLRNKLHGSKTCYSLWS